MNTLKVLVVNANKNMRDTLKMMMMEHFSEENITLCSNEHDALWYSVETKPDIVIVSYGPKDGNSYGLLKRLRTMKYNFIGLVVYVFESLEYEASLINVLSSDSAYRGIIPVRFEKLNETIGGIILTGPDSYER